MVTKQSATNLGLYFIWGRINGLVEFPAHFNPNNFLFILLQISLLLKFTLALRVCPREDQADVTHAISPICLKLSQMIKVIELFKSPK